MTDLRVDALTDIQAFCDLINYQEAGMSGFSNCHKDLFNFTIRNQLVDNTTSELRRDIVLYPREHRKSTIRTVIYPMWRLYRNPNLRILIGCNDLGLAKGFIREIKQYFEDEELQELVWNNRPHVSGDMIPALNAQARRSRRATRNGNDAIDQRVIWNAEQIQIIRPRKFKEPSIEIYSIGTTPTGSHYELLLLDDIVDNVNSKTELKAKKIDAWANDLENVVTKMPKYVTIFEELGIGEWAGDEIKITGTRYFAWDYYSKFVGNDDKIDKMVETLEARNYSGIVKNIYVNNVDNSDGYIFPEEFDATIEDNLKRRLKPSEFAAQYLLKILASEEEKFKEKDIRILAPAQIINTPGLPIAQFVHDTSERENGKAILLHAYMDTAISLRETADRTAIGIGGFDFEWNFFLVDLVAGRWDAPDMVEQAYRLLDKWSLNTLIYEGGVGLADAVASMFRYQMSLGKRRHISLITDVPPRSITKEEDIELRLLPLFTGHKFYTFSRLLNDTPLGDELKYFGTGGHDDRLDVVKGLIKYSKPTRQNAAQNYNHKLVQSQRNSMYGGVRI